MKEEEANQIVVSVANGMLELYRLRALEGLGSLQNALDQLTVVSTTRRLQHCALGYLLACLCSYRLNEQVY